MPKSDSKIIKRGTVAKIYKYTISDDQVMTIKGAGELGDYGDPFKFSAENLAIAEGIKSIGNSAFWNHSEMKTVRIPDSVTRIGSSAFGRCHALQSPVLPDSIVEIDNCAFDECYGFDRITLPRNLKILPLGTFRACRNLQEIDLSNVEIIREDAFLGCKSLKEIVIPQTVTYIGENAFKDCESLETVVFTGKTCKIKENIFEGCFSLKKVVLPASYVHRNLGLLWGKHYTSLVNDIVESQPYDGEYPVEAIKTFYKEYDDSKPECYTNLDEKEKSLGLNESTTVWGFATLTKLVQWNEHNAEYRISFEEYSQRFTDTWFESATLKSFIREQFLSRPVDRYDELSNNYTRYIYRWNDDRSGTLDQNPEYVQACRLLGEELMTPYYTLDENRKVTRLEEPAEEVDMTEALDGFWRLIGEDSWPHIGKKVENMICEFGAIKACRALGFLIREGIVSYSEYEIGKETSGSWYYNGNKSRD